MKNKKVICALITAIFISASITTSAFAVSNCICGASRTAWCSGYTYSVETSHQYGPLYLLTCNYVAGIHNVTVSCNSSTCTQPDVYTSHINMEFGHSACGAANFYGSCSGGDVSSWF